MRRRFSLYGFLKNQRYFEPFLWLAFLDRGLDFLDIGLLVAIREAVVVLLELPSGALADAMGRRRVMLVSFVAYVVAFPMLALASSPYLLAVAMAAYGVGDAFRTGTHKAMIFTWLANRGRQQEGTEFYGYTRSWSKIGSAVSIVIGAAVVLIFDRYEPLFLLSTLPYLVGIANLAGYPAELDGDGPAQGTSVGNMLRSGARRSWEQRPLRRIMLESMGFEGLFHATKDYLQPVLALAAVTIFVGMGETDVWTDVRRTALLAGPVYLLLYVGAAVASRQAHRVVAWAGGATEGAHRLWGVFFGVYVVLAVGDLMGAVSLTIVAFAALHVLQNLWRPALVTRIDELVPAIEGATILSMESLARSLATMVWAPTLGAAVDWALATGPVPGRGIWVLGVAGGVAAVAALLTTRPGAQHLRDRTKGAA